jgi:uncharacterized MAPEG superfamily protein
LRTGAFGARFFATGHAFRFEPHCAEFSREDADVIHLPVLVVLLNVLVLLATGLIVARARDRHGIKAPATTGHPDFERAFRVQMNTLEHTVLFLPTLWLAATWGNPTWAGILGLVWIAARVWYIPAYLREAGARHNPFMLSMIAWALLLLLAIWGVVRLFVLQPG